jgi:hypothetical protein
MVVFGLCWSSGWEVLRLAELQERMAELASTSSMMGEVRFQGLRGLILLLYQGFVGVRVAVPVGEQSCRSAWPSWPAPAAWERCVVCRLQGFVLLHKGREWLWGWLAQLQERMAELVSSSSA